MQRARYDIRNSNLVHFYYHFNSRALSRAARVLPPHHRCTGVITRAHRNRENFGLDNTSATSIATYMWCMSNPVIYFHFLQKKSSLKHLSTLRYATSTNRKLPFNNVHCNTSLALFLQERKKIDEEETCKNDTPYAAYSFFLNFW